MQTLISNIDHSVNFIQPQQIGNIEARYVRRSVDYFIVYLSSQTGCNQQCAMCHLTATNQRKFENVTIDQYVEQAKQVFDHYLTQPVANKVHFNYMARGEPLANPHFIEKNSHLFNQLSELAVSHNLFSAQKVSTIIPSSVSSFPNSKTLCNIFTGPRIPDIYYSLYSLNESFRTKWLPNALDGHIGLDMLAEWQQTNQIIPKIHYAFIEDENDSVRDMEQICNAIISRNLLVDFNVVRYNPYSTRYGQESSLEIIERNVNIINQMLPRSKVKIVPKVGFDVKASCGMFVGDRGNKHAK